MRCNHEAIWTARELGVEDTGPDRVTGITCPACGATNLVATRWYILQPHVFVDENNVVATYP